MLRLARQRSRVFVRCTQLSRFVTRQKHIPTTNKTIITPTIATTKLNQGAIEIIDPETIVNLNELPFRLPVICVGDYVEAFRNGQYSGMVVGQKKSSGGLQQLTVLLRNGKTFDIRSDSVAFCLKDFAKSQQVSQTVTEPVNLKDVDSNGLLKTIPVAYNRAIQHYQRTLRLTKATSHQQFESMYKHFSKEKSTVSLDELASFVFKRTAKEPVTPLQCHATFLYMVSDNIHFIPTRDVRGSNTWQLRPQEECDKISRIIASVRTRDESYTGFLSRAKSLITFYNNHADPALGTLSQTSLEISKNFSNALTQSDIVFINFVADWIRSPKVIVDSPYEIFVPNILKALKSYDTLFFDRSLAIRFLKEVGMFKPWDNVGLVEDAAVAGEFIWSKEAKKNEEKMNKFTTAFLSGKSNDFIQDDPYQSIRHDFGDLRVYTIDDPSAKEIDDGISIEHIPGQDSPWLHVHIADPTTYISPSHELTDLMQTKVQTLYLPERHFPMLPEELSSKKFSLGSTAHTNKDGSQYALTFSTRLDGKGNLIDYKIRPSLVKNVVKIYYDDADKLLQDKTKIQYDPLVDITKSFSHPNSIAFANQDNFAQQRESTVKEDCKKDLLDIFELSNQHAKKRRQNGAIFFSKASPVIELLPSPLDLPQIDFTRSNYASSLPAIRVTLDKSGYSPARQMVAETMIMGGRIASKFSHENNIHIPYRTQSWNPSATTEDRRLREEMLASRNPDTGMIELKDMVQYMSILPPSTVTTKPGLPHVVMGIRDGYTRATSPLRRFLDVVVHWQIKSHLLGKKRAPFSLNHLNSLAKGIESREKQLSILQQKSIQFWVISLLDRMRADGFTDTMEWNCIVNMPSRTAFTELGGTMEMATGTLLELGIRGRIIKLNRQVQVGEVVKVRVSGLDPLLGRVNLELI
ncbi:hypothetical protein MFLAVUS_000662 [Mucor flavus]|uniref:RNB domain-containing protein n=1 Tax=Mucor flavus TaxID=439312 RepID=A0ABP9YKD2_9FUNG